MNGISVILPKGALFNWHAKIVERLEKNGHTTRVYTGDKHSRSIVLDMILKAEKIPFNVPDMALADPAPKGFGPFPSSKGLQAGKLTIDLTGRATNLCAPVLSLAFSSGDQLHQIAAAIAAGDLPNITATIDGKPVAIARPMIDNRQVLSAGLGDVLARAISLLVSVVEKFDRGSLQTLLDTTPSELEHRRFLPSYLGTALPGILREAWRRKNYRFAHWRVGYRFTTGDGVGETNTLAGGDWHVLPDDGTHFYADPFAFNHDGQHYILVEDYPHATGKAVISVTTIAADGSASTPVPVLEEDWHLSYPQVFTQDGEIWMLPEASAGNTLILYRAEQFPNKWTRHTTLIEDCQLSDATLLTHDGQLWLFATDKDGAGSTSDMMVAYSAKTLEGPWTPHPANPICIDRTRARPGGAFMKTGGRLLLPVQDGTLGYGGGLGIVEITQLTPTEIRFSQPEPIKSEGFWPYPRIHTLNRVDALEVIDGIAEVAK